MPVDAPPTFLDLIRAEAARCDAAEAECRARFAEELRALERARIFANRRAALLAALASAIEGAPDDAAAYAAGERVLEEETGLTRASEAHGPLIDAFRPVIDAIDTLLNCEDEATQGSVLKALATYEAKHKTRTGNDFLALYDVYRPETPVVDF
ncbi:MAG: hypothetical protein LCH39_00555 [Proteobacteria bacterium]|nr:hypothetical protein [Pseudomonadota bacterium]